MAIPSRSLVVAVKMCLGVAGLWLLVKTDPPAPNSAYHQGQIEAKAVGALILVLAAVPWRGPPSDVADATEDL
jgi:hypothetical protein